MKSKDNVFTQALGAAIPKEKMTFHDCVIAGGISPTRVLLQAPPLPVPPPCCGRTQDKLDDLLKTSEYGKNDAAYKASFFKDTHTVAGRTLEIDCCKKCGHTIDEHRATMTAPPSLPLREFVERMKIDDGPSFQLHAA